MKQSLTIAWVLITDLSGAAPRRVDRARIVARPASDAARVALLETSRSRPRAEHGATVEPRAFDERRPEHRVETTALPHGG